MKTISTLLTRIEALAVENADLRRSLDRAYECLDAESDAAQDLARQVRSLEEQHEEIEQSRDYFKNQLENTKWELTDTREALRVEKCFHAAAVTELKQLKVKGIELAQSELDLIHTGNWIEACKRLRTRTGCDLATAKHVVDQHRK